MLNKGVAVKQEKRGKVPETSKVLEKDNAKGATVINEKLQFEFDEVEKVRLLALLPYLRLGSLEQQRIAVNEEEALRVRILEKKFASASTR